MTKIKTDDLPVDEALSEEEMRETRGGFTSSAFASTFSNVTDALSSATDKMTAPVSSLVDQWGSKPAPTTGSKFGKKRKPEGLVKHRAGE